LFYHAFFARPREIKIFLGSLRFLSLKGIWNSTANKPKLYFPVFYPKRLAIFYSEATFIYAEATFIS
jgi:hypothetical protein